ASAVADALAALRALPKRPQDVIVWGHSLGAGIALGVVQALLQGEQARGLQRSFRLASFSSRLSFPLPMQLRIWLRAGCQSACDGRPGT
ncbi:unnamed protein product, partial [Polarella glacialis]